MNDLISRKTAIDALKRDEEYDEDIPNRADGVRMRLLPSAVCHPHSQSARLDSGAKMEVEND